MSASESTGGWRRNPAVAVVAVIAIVLASGSLLSRVACRSTPDAPQLGDTVDLYCPHCKEFHQARREQLGLRSDTEGDDFQLKASQAPCPKCGKADSVVAVHCRFCDGLLVPPADFKAIQAFKCPHCGKHPWQRGK